MQLQIEFPEDMWLSVARAKLEKDREKGAHCPCCDQYAKIYNRKLNSAMAKSLILVEKYFNKPYAEEYLHIENYLAKYTRATDFYKLRFWGLIESKGEQRRDGSPHAGFWKMLPKGHEFVRNQIRVPMRVALYNDEFMGESDETISIVEALGEHFDYQELMKSDLF
jgi:hypothetical protein